MSDEQILNSFHLWDGHGGEYRTELVSVDVSTLTDGQRGQLIGLGRRIFGLGYLNGSDVYTYLNNEEDYQRLRREIPDGTGLGDGDRKVSPIVRFCTPN